MYRKIIEIKTAKENQLTGNNIYVVELVNSEDNNKNTRVRVFFMITENQLTLKTEFKGRFENVKKLLNNYVSSEINDITLITEY